MDSLRSDAASPAAAGVPPMTGLAGLGAGDALDTTRLLGMIVALAGEVFVLKAELQRTRLALAERGTLDDAALDAAGASPAMGRWLAAEEAAFGAGLLRPFTHPDEAPDVSRFMQER